MLKFSFGLPKRALKKLSSIPQVSDLQEMLTASMQETDKDIGVTWSQSGYEFKLVVRHRASQLLWRMMSGAGLGSQVVWSSNEANIRKVFSQVVAKANDLVETEGGGNAAPAVTIKQSVRTTGNHTVPGSVSGGTKEQGRTGESSGKPTSKAGDTSGVAGGAGQTTPLTGKGNATTADCGSHEYGDVAPWQRKGDLNRVRVFHLLQSLCAPRITGRLTISTSDEAAELYFDMSTIVHASSSTSSGDDTVLEVVCWEAGSYEFQSGLRASQQTVTSPLEQLMLKDMELLSQASELEEAGLQPTSFVCRQRDRLGDGALEELMQKSVAIKRIFLSASNPISVTELIERVQLPRSQFVPALRALLASGLLMFWNEDTVAQPTAMPADAATGGHQRETANALERFAFQQSIKAKPDMQDELWVQALATPGGVSHNAVLKSKIDDGNRDEIHPESRQFAQSAFELIVHYSSLFNRNIVDNELTVTPSELGETTEAPSAMHNTRTQGQDRYAPPVPPRYWRWRAATTLWSLSCRARGNCVELYLVPARESVMLSQAEQEFRRRVKMERISTYSGTIWMADGLPVSSIDIRALMRNCFRDLVRTTITDLQFEDLSHDPQQQQENIPQAAMYAMQHMKQVILEKQNLAQKIVSQQEEIQRRIARDLHDAVIADVTMLRRSLDGESKVSSQEIVKSLEEISHRLREICYDLSPSDLRDWGLHTTIEALLDHVSQRTGAECELIWGDDVPALEGPVELHIFRVIQEALNNSGKYSGASYISVTTEVDDGWLTFRVEDNGKGFDQETTPGKATKEGGMGMGSMLERTQLIQCFYPAKLDMVSQPGKGTITRLRIKLPANANRSV